MVIDERAVELAWERQSFDPMDLEELGLQVIFRGVPSDAGGPDYQDVILADRSQDIIQGDVEFHVRASDWYRHGHHLDSRYCRVVLHVVWLDDGRSTVRFDGEPVPVFAIGAVNHTLPLPEADSLLGHPCASAFASHDLDAILSQIREAGAVRFRERADRFAADLTYGSADQVAYTALLESLGYASNRSTFRALGDAVPIGWLMSLPPILRLPALLDAARLGPDAPTTPPSRLRADSWRLARIRPGNHPAIRLRGLSLLLDRFEPNLAEGLVDAVLSARRPSELRTKLMSSQEGHPYIGVGRADEIAVSVVLPLVASLEPDSDRPLQLYLGYPAPPANRWTRVMQSLLTEAGRDIVARKAIEHQGLHHLYHAHCRYERRSGCPVCGNA